MEPVPVLVVASRPLLLRVRGQQRRVDVERDRLRPRTRVPHPRPSRSPRRTNPAEQRARRPTSAPDGSWSPTPSRRTAAPDPGTRRCRSRNRRRQRASPRRRAAPAPDRAPSAAPASPPTPPTAPAVNPTRSANSTSNAAPACDTSPSPSAVTSTVPRRASGFTNWVSSWVETRDFRNPDSHGPGGRSRPRRQPATGASRLVAAAPCAARAPRGRTFDPLVARRPATSKIAPRTGETRVEAAQCCPAHMRCRAAILVAMSLDLALIGFGGETTASSVFGTMRDRVGTERRGPMRRRWSSIGTTAACRSAGHSMATTSTSTRATMSRSRGPRRAPSPAP